MAVEEATTLVIKCYGLFNSCSFLGCDGASHKLAFFVQTFYFLHVLLLLALDQSLLDGEGIGQIIQTLGNITRYHVRERMMQFRVGFFKKSGPLHTHVRRFSEEKLFDSCLDWKEIIYDNIDRFEFLEEFEDIHSELSEKFEEKRVDSIYS